MSQWFVSFVYADLESVDRSLFKIKLHKKYLCIPRNSIINIIFTCTLYCTQKLFSIKEEYEASLLMSLPVLGRINETTWILPDAAHASQFVLKILPVFEPFRVTRYICTICPEPTTPPSVLTMLHGDWFKNISSKIDMFLCSSNRVFKNTLYDNLY